MGNIDSITLSSIYKLKKSDRDIFQELMPTKVKEVLLLATLYDSYSIVREGQFTDKIFGEFLQLNLYAYPRFTSVNSEEEALRTMKIRDFDLVIIMVGVDKNIPVRAANALYNLKPQVPILLLVNNNGDLRYFQMSSPQIESIDRVFVWNGNSNVFLAMIKYIEDKKNVEEDTRNGSVRIILLIEDSIQYYSSGGINIIDDMHTPGQTPPRFDFAVQVHGPLVARMHAECQKLWERVAWATLQFRPRLPRLREYANRHAGSMRAALLVRDNVRHRRDIEDAYLAAINSAAREIIIANAYFLPGRRFRQALTRAAARGVSVTLILQGRVEYALMHYASQALYGSLLSKGVRIVEYRRSFLHAKAAVVDDDWATVGSSNIDPFSLMLAREANVVVRNIGFAQELRQNLLQAAQDGGRELRHRQWKRRPFTERMLRWLAYGAVRLMIGMAGDMLVRRKPLRDTPQNL